MNTWHNVCKIEGWEMALTKSAFATSNQSFIKLQTREPTSKRMSNVSWLFNLARLLADKKSASRPPSPLKMAEITILHIEDLIDDDGCTLRTNNAYPGNVHCQGNCGGDRHDRIEGYDVRGYLQGENFDCNYKARPNLMGSWTSRSEIWTWPDRKSRRGDVKRNNTSTDTLNNMVTWLNDTASRCSPSELHIRSNALQISAYKIWHLCYSCP